MSIKDFVKSVLTERENGRYTTAMWEKEVNYGSWMTEQEKKQSEQETADMSKDLGKGCELAVIFAAQGRCAPEIYKRVVSYFAEHPDVMLLYVDEDIWEEQWDYRPMFGFARKEPWFKPEWSPDLLDSYFYFGSVVFLRKDLFRKGFGDEKALSSLRFMETREEFGAQLAFYEAANFKAYVGRMRLCVMMAGGYQKQSSCIGHLPQILFHASDVAWQKRYLEEPPFYIKSDEDLLEDFRNHWGVPKPTGDADSTKNAEHKEFRPVVSVVIPSKDQPELLEKCLNACRLAAGDVPFEVIIVDNGSSTENQNRIKEMLGDFDNGLGQFLYLYEPREFNFSQMCNIGAGHAKGEFLLFLNDDVELCVPGCVEKMAALAERGCTGAVGIKLYYPDSVRIQHVGITNLPMGPVHKLQFLEDNRQYYFGANQNRRNVLAVTAACLMVEKDKYLEAGGFAEELRVAFNDVDFCFRLYELGYHNVCMNDLHAYHHESMSRGGDESPQKLKRLLQERDILYKRHPALEGVDPYYSPYLNRDGLDTQIRLACLTAENKMQKAERGLSTFSIKKYRQDECLMVRVEDSRGGRIVGYGVVLGDDNSCYEKRLLLRKVKDAAGADTAAGGESELMPQEVYAVKIQGQYRIDLVENMPDQVNVALSGFDVELGEGAVPPGSYLLGIGARNRVTGIKLVNWSNRVIEL